MRTADLTGALLALWVARAQGIKWAAIHEHPDAEDWCAIGGDPKRVYAPHEDWAQGGPIAAANFGLIAGANPVLDCWPEGADLLPFLMRAYVASVYGDTVPEATKQLPGGTNQGENL